MSPRAPNPQGQLTPPASGSRCRPGPRHPSPSHQRVEQTEGADYEIDGSEIHFTRPIVKEKVSTGRWLAMYLGLFGSYRKDEKVDLQFSRDGKVHLVPDLPLVPYPDADSGQ